MSRRASREIAMKLLYQLDIQRGNREEQIRSVLEENSVPENEEKYIRKIVEGVFDNISLIDSNIEKNMRGWKINRIPKVDLAILRLSCYEILFMDEIPVNVSINEAINLAKTYSSEESGAYINAVLGKIVLLREQTN